ncbi:MAG: DUF2059 domain-containing protein [Verrucomicrobiales bacterium]|nr:DUF2059 domain-containing protein [Verrucomicrobiales bacterium]
MKNRISGLAVCFATVLLFSLVSTQAAPEEALNPETVAAVEKFMTTMKVKENMAPALEGVKNMQMAMLDQQGLSEEEKISAKKIMEVSMGEVEKMLSWENIGAMMVRVYAKVFTTEEVNDLIKLFETPAGQVYVNKQMELQQASMQEMQKIMIDIMPKIQAKTKEAVKQAMEQEAEKK